MSQVKRENSGLETKDIYGCEWVQSFSTCLSLYTCFLISRMGIMTHLLEGELFKKKKKPVDICNIKEGGGGRKGGWGEEGRKEDREERKKGKKTVV